MCGIGGILRTDGQPIPEEWLDAIDARIAYRGPDGHGRFRDRVEIEDPTAPAGRRVVEVAFVHRRLSIIDHKDGAQPMVSERGRNDSEGLVAVVFNGCIYNHRELRKELESKGHTFVTDHSDTEVLIHGWREWGEQLPKHLEGMFAFALWDRTTATLAMARDPFGEKPLYLQSKYSENAHPESIAFSSEASSIAWPPIGACEPHELAYRVSEYLDVGYAWNGQTFFSPPEIWNLDPGRQRIVDRKGEHGRSSGRGGGCPHPFEPGIEQLLNQAVQRRLEADVPLGCFLSGGVDSSLIAHYARQHNPDLQTFSVRMPDARYDESPQASMVASHLGIRHTTLEVAARPAEDLVKLIHLLGQPFGDSSLLPTYWVSKAAKDRVKVALSGDGGDELFIGYERYMAAQLLDRYWRFLSYLPPFLLIRTHPKSIVHKLGRLGEMARNFRKVGIRSMEAVFTNGDVASLLGGSGLPDEDEFGDRNALRGLRSFDIDQYLPNDLLTKVDTASMACGLEVRCPFLDNDLACAALAAPIEWLMPGGQRKGLLRQIARKYLPKEIVDRPKMGFAIPIGEWFRDDNLPHKGSGMKTLLLDHLNSAEPFGPIQLNRKAVQRFIDEHMSGGIRGRDHGQRLFTLLTLSIWAHSLRETQKSTKTQRHKSTHDS